MSEHIPSKTMTHIEELRHVAAMESCSWDYAQKLMRSSAAEIERLRGALESLWPGLVLDLRYAEPDDDKDAMQSRIDTVRDALNGERRASDETNESEWVIVYADQDRLTEHFSGAGADTAARARFEQLKMAWTCRLFRCVDKTGYGPELKANPPPPTPWPGANPNKSAPDRCPAREMTGDRCIEHEGHNSPHRFA